ncbi:MAG TPA: AraC family transcriptional regulator [Polyangiaceae bacterium]|nr:AraC family transcriptional regulator [Polyangiaceae bacterium]
MDLLADLFKQAGLRRRLLDVRQLDASTAFRFPCDKSMGLHVATQGRCHIHTATLEAPLVLDTGDVALMARGCHHVLSAESKLGQETKFIATSWDERLAEQALEQGHSTVISGAYQLWNAPVHPFLADMPDWFVVRSDSLARLGPLPLTVALLSDEASRSGFGSELIVNGLFDVIFSCLLREMVERHGASGAGFFHAVADAQVRRALTLMHEDCAHGWTLEELASRSGLSRTTLAERFREAMGETPLSYLRTVRMQCAMRILSETDKNLEQVSMEVGYHDAFSFSKAFKRTLGVAPKEFRARDQRDKALPWRFGDH